VPSKPISGIEKVRKAVKVRSEELRVVKAWEVDVLAYDFCSGDKDDGGVRLLSNRVVIARVGRTCWHCCGPVQPGTRVRVETVVLDGEIKHSVTCHDCCDAMARSRDDGGDAMEARFGRYAPWEASIADH